MAVTEEEVVWAYRMILGREPESRAAIQSHLHCKNITELRAHFMNCHEFRSNMHLAQFTRRSKWVAVEVLGSFIQWVDLHDRYVSLGCLNNNYEPSETSYFISRLGSGHTVLDIGANIGWFTLVAAKHLGPEGRIHAFEPRPETLRMLKRTIRDNGLQDRVTVWPYALADQPGKLKLTWGKETDNPGGSFLVNEAKFGNSHDTAEVTVAVLDELLPEITPDIIKIDVEGAEPRVFRGARKAIDRKKPPILSELHPAQLMKVSGATSAQYIDQMADYGYRCYLLENGKPTRKLQDFPNDIEQGLISVVFEYASQ
ncbi:MAG TPA: FkbM family methyltransferase [Terriglobia bacterium]|nr:FkbM family methyltransferase [Terriglobia bacterium]